MSKKQKSSDKNDILTKRIILVTAILNLIKSLVDLLGKWLD